MNTLHRPVLSFVSAAVFAAGLSISVLPSTADAAFAPRPNCPYVSGPNRTVAQLNGRLILSSPLETSETALSLPAGTYRVTAFSSDGYDGRETVSQAHEQWRLRVKNSAGSLLVQSARATSDIPDRVYSATTETVIDDALVVPSGTAKISAYHAFPSDTSSPNSVNPVCVQFELLVPDLSGSCSVEPDSGEIGDEFIWSATASGGTGNFTYLWNGTDGLSGTSATLGKTYSTEGTKTGTVTITSGNNSIQKTCRIEITVEEPVCPFTPEQGRIVVNFNRDRKIRSDQSQSDSQSGPVGVSIPAGAYRVSLASSDSYAGRESVSQPHEQWKALLRDSGGTIASSNAIGDLADNIRTAFRSEEVNSRLVVSRDGASVLVVHAVYPDSTSPNSVVPICASFERLDEEFTLRCEPHSQSGAIGDLFEFEVIVDNAVGAVSYSWSGSEDLTGTTREIEKRYARAGSKTAKVLVTVGTVTREAVCRANVEIEEIPSPTVGAYCDAFVSKARISWSRAFRGSQGYEVEIDNDGDWSNGAWSKSISTGTLTTDGPNGFMPVRGASGALSLSGAATYRVRVLYKETNEYGPTTSFTAIVCAGEFNLLCSVSPTSGRVGDTFTWIATPSGGTGSYTYSWNGADDLTGTSATVQKVYQSTGQKSATAVVTSGNQTRSVTCIINVEEQINPPCTQNCGGGGLNPPRVELSEQRYPGETNFASAYVYLSQIPYTGFTSFGGKFTPLFFATIWWLFVGTMAVGVWLKFRRQNMFSVFSFSTAALPIWKLSSITSIVPATAARVSGLLASVTKIVHSLSFPTLTLPRIGGIFAKNTLTVTPRVLRVEEIARDRNVLIDERAAHLVASIAIYGDEHVEQLLSSLVADEKEIGSKEWVTLTFVKVKARLFSSHLENLPYALAWIAQGHEAKLQSLITALHSKGYSLKNFAAELTFALRALAYEREVSSEPMDMILSVIAGEREAHELYAMASIFEQTLEVKHSPYHISLKIAVTEAIRLVQAGERS